MSVSKTSKLLSQLDQHFGKCAVLAAAGVGAGMMSTPLTAEAAIVHNAAANLNVPSTTSGIYLNVVTGVSATSPGGAIGWDINPWSSSTLQIWANNGASPNDGVINNLAGGSSATLVDNLPTGTTIDGSFTFGRTNASETAGATALVVNSSNNLVGFRFQDEVAQCQKFGWARFSLAGTLQAQPRTLVEYAYENDCGVGIPAGVPEPGSLALLALGAAGLIRRRSSK